MKIIKDVSMAEYTSFRAGGTAEEMLVCETIDDIKKAVSQIKRSGCRYFFLGNGSNTLFCDGVFRGKVVMLGQEFAGVSVQGESLTCGSAVLLSKAARAALDSGLTGLEFASGIPGSVGGALFMDAGAYGKEMKDIVRSARVFRWDSEEICDTALEDMDLSYRHSAFQGTGDIILEVTFDLSFGDKEAIEREMKDLMIRRNEKQPVNLPSAGSFFKRPEGHFAGKLIEDAGLKGLAVGGARVSDKHAGFIVNEGGATATEIISLMHLVQNTVYDRQGVMLEPEVRIVENGSE